MHPELSESTLVELLYTAATTVQMRDLKEWKSTKPARGPISGKMLTGHGVFESWESGRIDGSIDTEDGPIVFEHGLVRRTSTADVQSGPLSKLRPALEEMRTAIVVASQTADPVKAVEDLQSIAGELDQVSAIANDHIRRLRGQLIKIDHSSSMDCRRECAWLEEAVGLEVAGEHERSLDVLFDNIDDLLLRGAFEDCSAFLRSVEAERLSNSQLLTILTATLPANNQLPDRPLFVNRVRGVLKSRGANIEALLAGLDK